MPSDDRLAETKRQIRDRLRKVCSHMTEEDFEVLVEKIATNELNRSAGNVGLHGYTWKADSEE